MMDDFETNLSTALRSAVPTPPTEIDPADITHTTGPRRARPLVAPLAAALVVAAVAVSVLALTSTKGNAPNQAASPPAGATTSPALPVSRQPSDLLGSWNLTDLQGFDGAGHTAPDAAVRFTFYANGGIGQGCSAASATVGRGTLQFTQDWVTATPTNCPGLGVDQSQFLFGQVLTGTATWEIHGDVLAIHRGGVTALFQRVGGDLSTAQRALATRIAKAEAWASPPPGSTASTSRRSAHADWPTNVDRVSAILTTHANAMRYVGAAGGDATSALVIRLVGKFSWETTGPPGHGPATGNVITIVINAHTGKTSNAGIERQKTPQPLPNATLLYRR